ncbi:MAG: hypothetical protein HF300_16710 [Ignavibacteria bacterium]|jgi:hypothetical protein|nr:hypothetical protein [Ignavibacteria bacterium]MCU7498646.1 hypothetical protein [Ignavibacteria bacterium]MCU7514204.1 hypothetical protein [Ignavibacteria bacterium]MCU7522597.1 hypothetical protein [Ignavibacteria bacterium]MCU7525976.1 hypothetical protein [Ignavibacteria bacterium]
MKTKSPFLSWIVALSLFLILSFNLFAQTEENGWTWQLNFFKTKAQLRLENIILRKQIEILQRTNPKLQIKRTDRLVFSIMKRSSV